MLSKYQDGTITPYVIDDIFGQNFSKVTAKLDRILNIIHKQFFAFIKTAEKDKTQVRRYMKIFSLYRIDLISIVNQNLNIEKTFNGNKDTLLYLRAGK
jgi:hypothetical protein